MVFPVVMYRCESWTVKKVQCRKIDVFELWCWRRLLRVPWIARRYNQSILKGVQSWVFIGRTDAEAETPILWPPHAKSWLIGKDPDAGRDWGQEEKGTTEDVMAGMASLTWWTWVSVNSESWWWTGRPGVLRFMGSQRVGHDWVTELNWTERRNYLTGWCSNPAHILFLCNQILCTHYILCFSNATFCIMVTHL